MNYVEVKSLLIILKEIDENKQINQKKSDENRITHKNLNKNEKTDKKELSNKIDIMGNKLTFIYNSFL